MCDGSVSLQESIRDSDNDISSNSKIDFVQLFPSELSQKLFSYLPDRDLLSCCYCSSDWKRTIDEDGLWKLMCRKRGWVNTTETDPLKWTRVLSHVAENQTFKFRPSPVYPGSNDLLCDWGLYFRHCFHLQLNWEKGICVIEEMGIPEEFPATPITNDASCTGKFLATATNLGHVFLWSLEGVPKLLATIEPEEDTLTVPVEAIQLTSEFLIVLYENKELHVYLLLSGNESKENSKVYEHFYKTEIKGETTENPAEFRLDCIDQVMDDNLDLTIEEENDRHNVNHWIQNFVDWNVRMLNTGANYSASDLMLLSSENIIVLTGMDCRNMLLFDVSGKTFIKSIDLPREAKCCCKCVLSSSKLFISAKKVVSPGSMEHREVSAFYIFVFDKVSNSFEENSYTEINAISQVEEIQADVKSERVVYVSHHGAVMGFDLNAKDFLFLHQSNGNVDNLLVIGDYILYHQFHGRIFALNWRGEVLYDIDAHIGIVRGIKCVNQFIISAGDAMELCVWDLKTGRKIYAIYHQPCRIQHLYADETKIVTVGKEDPPVLIGFW